MAGNIFRGALGQIFRRMRGQEIDDPYTRIFEPRSVGGPSGLLDAPRPFVLRPQNIEGQRFRPGDAFCLDVHFFDLEEKLLACFISAFLQFTQEGLGPGRASVELAAVRALTLERSPDQAVWNQGSYNSAVLPTPLQIDFRPPHPVVERLKVAFRTPTELKSEGSIHRVPEFPVLLGRVRDRISTLRSLYGQCMDFGFKAMGARSEAVRLADYQVQWQGAQRRSSRTGQQHWLSGFVGWAEYEGNLGEFVPWLQAGYWSGVGRQTVWGKGEIVTDILDGSMPPGNSTRA